MWARDGARGRYGDGSREGGVQQERDRGMRRERERERERARGSGG